MLDPRRIALQGIGYAAIAIAVQGFSPTVENIAPLAKTTHGADDALYNSEFGSRLELQRIQIQNELILAVVMAAVAQRLF